MDNFIIFAVSDGTAATAKLLIQAVLAQFPKVIVEIKTRAHNNTEEKIRHVIQEATEKKAIIAYTLVHPAVREILIQEGRKANIPVIDLLGPLLCRLEEFLQVPPKGIPGIFKPSLYEYDQRIEAIDFTVDHDDGQSMHSLDPADIVILGVSRTSKTPLSIYLSYRGWKVANISIIPDIKPDEKIYQINQKKIVALTIKAEQLASIRQKRMEKFNLEVNNAYSALKSVQKEVSYAEAIFAMPPVWPIINVTNKSIEEIAQEVISILAKQGFNKN